MVKYSAASLVLGTALAQTNITDLGNTLVGNTVSEGLSQGCAQKDEQHVFINVN